MADTQTYTVTGSYADRDGKVWVFLRDLPGKYLSDDPVEDGTSMVIIGQKAVVA